MNLMLLENELSPSSIRSVWNAVILRQKTVPCDDTHYFDRSFQISEEKRRHNEVK
jgi:hypothetical protein